MPTSQTVSLSPLTWTQITAADVTNITFDNVGGTDCWIKRGAGTAPTDLSGAMRVRPGTRAVNEAIDEVWPGLSGARVWAFCITEGQLAVQHA